MVAVGGGIFFSRRCRRVGFDVARAGGKETGVSIDDGVFGGGNGGGATTFAVRVREHGFPRARIGILRAPAVGLVLFAVAEHERRDLFVDGETGFGFE